MIRSLYSIVLLGLSLTASAQNSSQTCTGLCLQQVTCPAGETTSITGTVYAPNGTDPLPDVVVYIPTAPVDAFTPGVSCPAVGTPPSGSPLLGTKTSFDGTFNLSNVPVGTDIPLVIQTGRWRRQLLIPATTACTSTSFSTRMPKNHGEGDIPLFAIATGSQDQVECVLRKVGLDDSEFTNPDGAGRIHLFSGSDSAGARIDDSTPSQTALMQDPSVLDQYDVLMLPCQGSAYPQDSNSLSNFISFANAGGRVYSSHFSYTWMKDNPPFDNVVNWNVDQLMLPDGIAAVDTTFAEGQTLAQWLQLVGATQTQGQMPISVLRHDLDGVVPPTQSWLTLNDPADGNPVMQFVFDTPVGAATNKCGRVLFNEYHVENSTSSSTDKPFPAECPALTAPASPQEKLLEYSLFELTNDGAAATLTPIKADFGSQPINFSTAPTVFTWTNNSTFPASASPISASRDFSVVSSNCATVQPGAGCQIAVTFTPTDLGSRAGVLSIGSGSSILTAALSGTGIPDLTLSAATLDFGSLDVGASRTLALSVTNHAPGSVALPMLTLSGDYGMSSSCGSSVPADSTCTLNITFTPTTTGSRASVLAVNSTSAAYTGATAALTGNGVDFTLALTPTSGAVIAGYSISMSSLISPIAGFGAAVSLSCSTEASASSCNPQSASLIPASGPATQIGIHTTAQYTVIGYGAGSRGILALVAVASGLLLWSRRRSSRALIQATMVAFLMTVGSLALSGCSGRYPAKNPAYTPPGTYAFNVIATDGFITHTAAYTLTVTAK